MNPLHPHQVRHFSIQPLAFQPCICREPFLHHFAPFSPPSFPSSLAHQPLTITNCTSWEGSLAGQSPIRRSALWDFVYFLYFVVALIRKPFLHHFAPFSRSSFPSSLAHQPLTITN